MPKFLSLVETPLQVLRRHEVLCYLDTVVDIANLKYALIKLNQKIHKI